MAEEQVVYEGPRSRSDASTEFIVDGVRLVKGVPTDVPSDDLRAELLAGDSDRLKGHKFSAASGDDDAAAADAAPATDEALGGGSGTTEGAPAGTARGRART